MISPTSVACPTCHAPIGRQNPGSRDTPLKREHPARATVAAITAELAAARGRVEALRHDVGLRDEGILRLRGELGTSEALLDIRRRERDKAIAERDAARASGDHRTI